MKALVVSLLLSIAPLASAQWQPDPGDKLQLRSAEAVQRIQTEIEATQPFFDDAYAYVVWPGIIRGAFGFGGAWGRGILIEQGKPVGTVRYFQFSSGIQAGAKSFAMIVFFKDEKTLASLKRNEWQFAGQAGVDFASYGAHGTPAYNEGVALFPITNFGLMGEFSASGVKYSFKPYGEDD
jgi:lipid-binding SYLF domain-containing protein